MKELGREEKKEGKIHRILVLENPARRWDYSTNGTEDSERAAEMKNPNEASFLFRIFHLDLTAKSSIGRWLISSQRSKAVSLREALGMAGALPPRRGQQGLGERVWAAVFRAAVMSAERKAGVRNVVQWPLCPPPLPSCSPAHTLESHSGFISCDTPRSCTAGHCHHHSPDMRCHLMCPRTCICALMPTHTHAPTGGFARMS